MGHSDHGIVKNKSAGEQPAGGERAQTADKAVPRQKPIFREATRDPRLADGEKTPGSGMTPDDNGDAPTG